MAEDSLDYDADSGQASDDENQRLELQELLLGEQLSNDEDSASVSDGGSLSISQDWEESHVLSASHDWEESRPLASHKEQEPSLVLTSYLTSQQNLEESHAISSYQAQGAGRILTSLQEQEESRAVVPRQLQDGDHPPTLPPPDAQPPVTSQMSHIFTGTSQEYSQLPAELATKPAQLVASQREAIANIPGHDQSNHLQHEQLEALYIAQKRRIKELEEESSAFRQEAERETGSLRHQTRQLLEERDQLSSQLTGCQQLYAQLQQSLSTAQNELARERDSFKEMVASRDQLAAELRATRSTIDGLGTQVAQLSSCEAIEKLRLNYDSALRTANEQHAQEVAHLQMQLGAARDQLHQLTEKKNFTQETAAELQCHGSSTDESEQTVSSCKELNERYLELVAESEDLQHQLSVVQEHLQQTEKRAQLAESEVVELCKAKQNIAEAGEKRLRDLESDTKELKQKLQDASAIAEHQKRISLEQCRTACLKLHEEATERLRAQLLSEKQLLMQEHRNELHRLREELGRVRGKLATTQDQYVAAVQQLTETRALLSQPASKREKESEKELQKLKVRRKPALGKALELAPDEREEREHQLQKQVQLAVAAARRIWQGEQQASVDTTVQEAMKLECERTRKKLEKEKSSWNKERECLCSQVELLKAQQKTTQETHRRQCMQLQAQLKTSLQLLSNDLVQLFSETLAAQECRQQTHGGPW